MPRALVTFWRDAVFASGLPPMTKLVGLALAQRMNRDGAAECSRAAVADTAGVGMTVTKEAVRRLERCGLLRVDRTVGGRAFVNRYQAVVPTLNGSQGVLFQPAKRVATRPVTGTETGRVATENGSPGDPVSRSSEDLSRARTRARTPQRFVPDDVLIAEANARAADYIAALAPASGNPVAKGTGS